MSSVLIIGTGHDIDLIISYGLIKERAHVVNAQYYDDFGFFFENYPIEKGFLVINVAYRLDIEEIKDRVSRVFCEYNTPLTVIFTLFQLPTDVDY